MNLVLPRTRGAFQIQIQRFQLFQMTPVSQGNCSALPHSKSPYSQSEVLKRTGAVDALLELLNVPRFIGHNANCYGCEMALRGKIGNFGVKVWQLQSRHMGNAFYNLAENVSLVIHQCCTS